MRRRITGNIYTGLGNPSPVIFDNEWTDNEKFNEAVKLFLEDILNSLNDESINDIGGSKTVHQFDNIIGNKTHPCEKPVDLLKFYISNSSREGDIVFNPFCGTGSTLVAAKELDRKYLGYEIDKEYFDIADSKLNSILVQ